MMPYKLKDGTRLKKWNGKTIEYRKDGSKIREIDYKYGGVTLRMEWDEAGNLAKEEDLSRSHTSREDLSRSAYLGV